MCCHQLGAIQWPLDVGALEQAAIARAMQAADPPPSRCAAAALGALLVEMPQPAPTSPHSSFHARR